MAARWSRRQVGNAKAALQIFNTSAPPAPGLNVVYPALSELPCQRAGHNAGAFLQQQRWTTGPGKGVPVVENTKALYPIEYRPAVTSQVCHTHKHGSDILHDPVFNKGTAFPKAERERLGLRGLLPPRYLTMETQLERIKDDYYFGKDWVDVTDGSVTREHVRKWRILQDLKDRNETLFYRLLIDDFNDLAPIVYTPTVGWASVNFHHVYRRPRGMFFSLKDRGEMAAMVHNWPSDRVDAIVVTDGSRILGLGDLGINGMAIPIGKLDLYVGAAGFNPGRVLPCVIDVGTDNAALRDLDMYMGLHQPRLTDHGTYMDILDEFVKAVMGRWPHAVLQFEDFNLAHAQPLLERYRQHHLIFNDDIQGTAATAVAGLYGAMKVQGLPLSSLAEQRFVVAGAGSAGMGVVSMICQAVKKQGKDQGEACANFWISDVRGLITEERPALSDVVKPFARYCNQGDVEGEALLDTIKRVKPTVIIGLTGFGKIFTPEILEEMGKNNDRPVIFAMSNPTSRQECTAEEAQKYTGGRAIFAGGSPAKNVEFEGRTIASSQANNMFIFPGLALGAWLGRCGVVTDSMIQACAEALPELIKPEALATGFVFPSLADAREISAKLALEVMLEAHRCGHMMNKNAQKELARNGEAGLMRYIRCHMYEPAYKSLVHLPRGLEGTN